MVKWGLDIEKYLENEKLLVDRTNVFFTNIVCRYLAVFHFITFDFGYQNILRYTFYLISKEFECSSGAIEILFVGLIKILPQVRRAC